MARPKKFGCGLYHGKHASGVFSMSLYLFSAVDKATHGLFDNISQENGITRGQLVCRAFALSHCKMACRHPEGKALV